MLLAFNSIPVCPFPSFGLILVCRPPFVQDKRTFETSLPSCVFGHQRGCSTGYPPECATTTFRTPCGPHGNLSLVGCRLLFVDTQLTFLSSLSGVLLRHVTCWTFLTNVPHLLHVIGCRAETRTEVFLVRAGTGWRLRIRRPSGSVRYIWTCMM